jgi:SAM-dependent methyltransferase
MITQNDREQLARRYSLRNNWLYRLLRPPLPLVHNPRESPLPACDGIGLWIGGAGQRVPGGFVNVDLIDMPGVNIVASIEALPFANDSIGRIECDAVLEHVRNADMGVQEMFRVLQPGGYLHLVVPFCHPLHLYPADYRRWSCDGLRELLAGFEMVAVGVRTGPTATLLTTVLEYVKVLAPRPLRKPAYAAAAWLLWPARYLDVYLNRKPEAEALANSIYALVRKPVLPSCS